MGNITETSHFEELEKHSINQGYETNWRESVKNQLIEKQDQIYDKLVNNNFDDIIEMISFLENQVLAVRSVLNNNNHIDKKMIEYALTDNKKKCNQISLHNESEGDK